MGSILSGYIMPHPPAIIPEIGSEKESEVRETISACNKVAEDVARLEPETVIVITPHGLSLADAISITVIEELKGDFRKWGKKDVKFEFENDLELVNRILEKARDAHFPLEELNESGVIRYDLAPLLDHGALIPLYYLYSKFPKFKIVHISMGFLEYEYLLEFGSLLREAIAESRSECVVVASGDLSHKLSDVGSYGYNEYGAVFDKSIVDILKSGNLSDLLKIEQDIIEEAVQCGLRSIITMAASMNESVKSEVLSYEGPLGVGYCVAKIENG